MFHLKISTANAAFDDEMLELARILRSVADKVEGGHRDGLCRDYNGNTIGLFKLTGEPREEAS